MTNLWSNPPPPGISGVTCNPEIPEIHDFLSTVYCRKKVVSRMFRGLIE